MVWSAFYPHLHHSLSKRCSSHNGHILVSGSHPPHPHPRPIPTRNPSDSTNPPPQALAPSRKGSFFPIISPIQLPLTRIMGGYTPGQACLLESAHSLFGDRAITAFSGLRESPSNFVDTSKQSSACTDVPDQRYHSCNPAIANTCSRWPYMMGQQFAKPYGKLYVKV